MCSHEEPLEAGAHLVVPQVLGHLVGACTRHRQRVLCSKTVLGTKEQRSLWWGKTEQENYV